MWRRQTTHIRPSNLSGSKESVHAYYNAYAKRVGASYTYGRCYNYIVSYADDTLILHGDGFYVALEPITIIPCH